MAFVCYGVKFDDPEAGVNPMPAIELRMAFDASLASAPGFLGRYQHLRNAIDLIWNEPRRQYYAERRMPFDERKHDVFIWNDWTELMMETLCEGHWATNIWGPNASWKTTTVALYVLCAWYASPTNTSVVVTSTSIPGLKKRIWGEVLKFYRLSRAGIGFLNATDLAIRWIKGDDKNGIFAVATGMDEGDVDKACNKIIGYHNTNVYAVVDEMQATNEAIVDASGSLEAGAEQFQLIGPGNPDTELDSLGRMSEPVNGYHTITVDDIRWETKRGVCIHLDGLESPRVKEGDEFYPGLLSAKDIESMRIAPGEDSPEFWQRRRGFIAPQGITKTVLSPSIINKFGAKEKAVWVSGFTMGAGLDPAFEGGDRCMLRFAKCGQMIDGKMGIELGELVQIKVEASSADPLHYQIVRQVKDLCEQHDPPVAPENFALDSTGEGGGLASIFQREWSPAITLIEFGGRASDLPVSEHNPKPAHQEYLYRVTELWYQFRVLVQNGQIRGLDDDTAKGFCQRRYVMRGTLKMLESKSDMKERTKKSPDKEDATVVVTELFRQTQHLGGIGEGGKTETDDAWTKFHREQMALLDIEHEYLVES